MFPLFKFTAWSKVDSVKSFLEFGLFDDKSYSDLGNVLLDVVKTTLFRLLDYSMSY